MRNPSEAVFHPPLCRNAYVLNIECPAPPAKVVAAQFIEKGCLKDLWLRFCDHWVLCWAIFVALTRCALAVTDAMTN